MSKPKVFFVTGIDTDSGKTLASAVLVEALKADYWKPVQAGFPTDSDTVRSLVSDERMIHPEGKILQAPMSPHAAAKLENIEVKINDLVIPQTNNTLVVEGAGGVMVPLNDEELIIELAKKNDLSIIVVSRNYLGSINHTLLTLEYLKTNRYQVEGVLFNDTPNPESEKFILNHSGLRSLGRLGHVDIVNKKTIKNLSQKITIK